jgi:alanine-glyoxylate transaminase / serine-glyoxylate transaminase / serine-pyruvate transaminase
MNVPGENHRDAFFAPFFKDVLEHTKYLFQTKTGTPFIFPGKAPPCKVSCIATST